MKEPRSTYWKNIARTIKTLAKGLKVTSSHIRHATKSRSPDGITEPSYFKEDQGLATLQYPHQSFSIPDNGRYRLHNEMDDCIVCDKCVKVCPVDCIEIDAIKATEVIGNTSDGTPKRIHAARFDIDMAKCCFCGLCTTVCPTESLTMTKSYDFSEFDVKDHHYEYATMTPLEILDKQKQLDEFNANKVAAAKTIESAKTTTNSNKPKMKFRPKAVVKKTNPEDKKGEVDT